MAGKLLIFVLAIFAVMAVAFAADCAASAYAKACASCAFDENGRIDQACYGGYKASGTTCTMAAYPITAGKYQAGECPQLGACIDELNSCVNQYKSGNDRADCQEGSVSVCFAAADRCTTRAAVDCGEIQDPCAGASSFIVLGALAALLFAGWKSHD